MSSFDRVSDFNLTPLPGPAYATTKRFSVATKAGDVIGFLEREFVQGGERRPWKAFAPLHTPGNRPQFGRYLGAFYGGRHYAIASLLALA